MQPIAWQELARRFETPLYLYDLDGAVAQLGRLRELFAAPFELLYALKANPSRRVLERLGFVEVRRTPATEDRLEQVHFVRS